MLGVWYELLSAGGMAQNQPRCPLCGGPTKRNGLSDLGAQRWLCKDKECRVSVDKKRPDKRLSADFKKFITHVTGQRTMADTAKDMGISRQYLSNRFRTFWYIPIPDPVDPHRVFDQIFIDGTRLSAGCLLIASTKTHIVNWVWAKEETTHDYIRLLKPIPEPLMVCLDGGRGAYSAIKRTWPSTQIQRCLVHAQRVVRRYVTSRPRTDAGRDIYRLARNLTRITDLDQAAKWSAQLHNFYVTYKDYLNEKTLSIITGKREFTHLRVRKAYYSLENLDRKQWLFTYLNPPDNPTDPDIQWASTTNSLEGGFNSPLKQHARLHRGRSGERQRKTIDWWLYLRIHQPQDPQEIAKKCNWGRDALSKVNATTHNENKANQETGRPALYDDAIPTEYNHSVGIRQGTIH